MERDFSQGCVVIGQGGMVLNYKRADLDQILGRNYSPWGWWGTGTGCPEKLWMSPPWKCSTPGWMELWATWSSGRCPWSWQGGWNQM